MRRIIHNSTAIAACLSLLAPHLAMAQVQKIDENQHKRSGFDVIAQADTETILPLEGEADAQSEADAAGDEAAPEGTEADADADAEADATAEDAEVDANTEAETADQTAAESEALAAEEDASTDAAAETSEQTAVETEAPGADEEPPAEKPADAAEQSETEGSVEADAEAPADTATETESQTEAEADVPSAEEKAPAAKPTDSEDQAAESDGDDVFQDQARPAPKGEKAQQKAAESEADGQPDQQEAPASSGNAAADAETAEETEQDSLAKALAEEEKSAEESTDDDAQSNSEAEADADAKTEGEIRLSDVETAMKRAENMSGLSKVLQGEIDSGLTADQLTCLSGAAYPCADGDAAMTPKGVVLAEQDDGSFMLASAKEQMYRVNKQGELVERAAEEGGVETEAAKEAAAATEAPKAAALTAEDGEGEVVEQEVTEENSRSSSEDFETSLRNALAGEAETESQEQAASSDDDDNDLTKALLLGLGAVAVGSMLNNNREVALSSPDRVVVTRADGSQEVIKDEVALFRQPGSTVSTENFDDGSSRTVVTRADGSKIVTIRDADLRVLRRTLVSADGTSTQLIDDTTGVEPVNIAELPDPAAPVQTGDAPLDEEQLRAALQRESNIDRRFSLGQIRNIPEVRALVAPVNIDAITFETGSAAIKSDQAKQLSTLGNVIQESVSENPREMFLIEGHTDTVGDAAMNLALSDRRAESVALALSEYFDVPPENLIVQGYGEQYLKVRTEGDVRSNRRASVRRITELLRTAE